MLTTSEPRAAWDTTISAPKSVSLARLSGRWPYQRRYRESVNETLKEFEKYLHAFGGGSPSRQDFLSEQVGYVKPLK